MRKKLCMLCGEDLLSGEIDFCENCIADQNISIHMGEINANKSLRRENTKDRREIHKRRNDEESE